MTVAAMSDPSPAGRTRTDLGLDGGVRRWSRRSDRRDRSDAQADRGIVQHPIEASEFDARRPPLPSPADRSTIMTLKTRRDQFQPDSRHDPRIRKPFNPSM
jgi:hypothetical protein